MPQMSPMVWELIMASSFSLCVFLSLNLYFLKLKQNKDTSFNSEQYLNNNCHSWKW